MMIENWYCHVVDQSREYIALGMTLIVLRGDSPVHKLTHVSLAAMAYLVNLGFSAGV